MIKRALIAATSILLPFCIAGCSFTGLLQDETKPDNDPTISTGAPLESTEGTTALPTGVSADPTDTQAPTTEPTQGETSPQQTITQPEPGDDDFVKVVRYIPDIIIDLRYST